MTKRSLHLQTEQMLTSRRVRSIFGHILQQKIHAFLHIPLTQFFVNSKLDLFKKEDNLAIVDNGEYNCIF